MLALSNVLHIFKEYQRELLQIQIALCDNTPMMKYSFTHMSLYQSNFIIHLLFTCRPITLFEKNSVLVSSSCNNQPWNVHQMQLFTTLLACHCRSYRPLFTLSCSHSFSEPAEVMTVLQGKQSMWILKNQQDLLNVKSSKYPLNFLLHLT